jgi:hypothetical protein
MKLEEEEIEETEEDFNYVIRSFNKIVTTAV